MKESVIAPNQKAITTINVNELRSISVTLTYKDMQGIVTFNTFQLNSGFSNDLMYVDANSSKLSDDANALGNMLHQYTKRNL